MAEEKAQGFGIFKNRNFAILWLGQLSSKIGNGLNWVVVMWIVYELTGSSLKMGLVGICQIVPLIILGPLFGAYLDRKNNKQRIMIISDTFRALFVVSIPVLYEMKILSEWHIYLIIILSANFGELVSIGINSSIPSIVAAKDLHSANSFMASTIQAGQFIGPALAAYLMARIGIEKVLYIDAATFLVSAISVSLINFGQANKKKSEQKHLWSEIKEGISYVLRDNGIITTIMFLVFFLNIIIPSLSIIIPIFSDKILGTGKEGFGYMFSGWGAGALTAFILLGSLKKQGISYKWITPSYIISGIFILALSFTRTLTLAILFFAITGFFIGMAGVLIYTFIQKRTPLNMLARMFAVYGAVTHAGIPLGMLLSGLILSFSSPNYLIAAIGICIMVAGIMCVLKINYSTAG